MFTLTILAIIYFFSSIANEHATTSSFTCPRDKKECDAKVQLQRLLGENCTELCCNTMKRGHTEFAWVNAGLYVRSIRVRVDEYVFKKQGRAH